MSETEQGKGAGEQPKQQPKGRAAHLEKYQFQPGQSGNPSGRRKGCINLTARLEKRLLKELADGTMEVDKVVEALIREMKDDPAKMTTFILKMMDRDEGPVVQQVELETQFTVEDWTRKLDAMDAMDAEGSPGRG